MDIERAVEFILEQQARMQADAEKYRAEAEQRRIELDQRFAEVTKLQDKNERQLRGLLKLAKIGAKTLSQHDERIKRLEDSFQEFLRRTDPRTNTN
jgi:hypothetical protein